MALPSESWKGIWGGVGGTRLLLLNEWWLADFPNEKAWPNPLDMSTFCRRKKEILQMRSELLSV